MGSDLSPSSLRLLAEFILGLQDEDPCVPSTGRSHWAFCFFKASVLMVTPLGLTSHHF